MVFPLLLSAAPSWAATATDGRAAVPFSMSHITLTGDWKHAQDANQEVQAKNYAASAPLPC